MVYPIYIYIYIVASKCGGGGGGAINRGYNNLVVAWSAKCGGPTTICLPKISLHKLKYNRCHMYVNKHCVAQWLSLGGFVCGGFRIESRPVL